MKHLIYALVFLLFFLCSDSALAKVVSFKITGKVTSIQDPDGYLERKYKNLKVDSKIIALVRFNTNNKYHLYEGDWFYYKIKNEFFIAVDKHTIAHSHKYDIRYATEFVPGDCTWLMFLHDDKFINFRNDNEIVNIPGPDRLPDTIPLENFPNSNFAFRWWDDDAYRIVVGNINNVTPLRTFTVARFFNPIKKNPLVIERKAKRIIPIKVVLHDEKGRPITDKNLAVPPVVQVFKQGSGGDFGKFVQECSLLEIKGTPANRMTYRGKGVWSYLLNTARYPVKGTYNIKVLTGDPEMYVIDQPIKARFRRK